MVFVLHAPLVFEQKLLLIPAFLNRKCFANILTIAKIVMHGTLCFVIENAAESFCFLKKLLHQDRISFKNRRVERQFQCKTEGTEAMNLTGISQGHDLVKSDDFEPLSL